MDIQSGGFQGRGKARLAHTSDPQMLDAGNAVQIGNGRFGAGPIAIPIFELDRLFVLTSSGQAQRFGLVAQRAALFLPLDRTARLLGTAVTDLLCNVHEQAALFADF